ncbi:glycosyltransferase family 4 protein [Desulfonema magnum]|uniref:Glycosyltransferase, family I n=1 Tax=Desulfonema magnum TaxID=45655 RepID=A0A975BIZ5_9BACT|nr:glycosyltransferase family 4 protein [Desulfonema magnum]QTA85990.1 Glycosyltransferase, family I [Desulfonema magnum]
MRKKIFLISRCAWTLYNFRAGLMRNLKTKNYTVVGGGDSDDGFGDKIEAMGVPFKSLPVSKKAISPFADILLFLTLFKWYRYEKPDIVHHFTIKPVIYGSLAARLARVPRIINTVTGLGFVFSEKKVTLLRYLVKWLYRLALRGSHFTFFLNQDDLNFFLSQGLANAQKTGLLPGEGVDCQFFSPEFVSDSVSEKPITFLMVSRMLRDKGVFEFVEAARLVKDQFSKVQFQLLGGRDERNPNVISQKDLDLWHSEGVVAWLGELADVRPVITKADVVVLPSFYGEGVPRVLLEAAAMGKPVITTDAVGCREVVDDGVNGFLVPVKNADALAQAMTRMIEDAEMRRTMGIAGRKKAEQAFDERIVIEKILGTY